MLLCSGRQQARGSNRRGTMPGLEDLIGNPFKRENAEDERKYVKMNVSAKWQAITDARKLGLGIGALLDARSSFANSHYGSFGSTSENWLRKLHEMYVEAACEKLARHAGSGVCIHL